MLRTLFILFLSFQFLVADDFCGKTPGHQSKDFRDFETTMEFVNSKRTISLNEKLAECLEIHGDVKFEYLCRSEKGTQIKRNNNGAINEITPNQSLRGGSSSNPGYTGEVEVNLYLNYKTDNTWLKTYVNFDNSLGIFRDGFFEGKDDTQKLGGSGKCNNRCLKKALWGWNFYECGPYSADIQVGRQKLYNSFSSRIQFSSQSDGIEFHLKRKMSPSWLTYGKVAGFIVDERSDHYAYVCEVGAKDFFETKWDITYNFIDWKSLQKSKSRAGLKNSRGSDFQNSQIILAYNINPDVFCRPAKVFGGFLYNHAARSGTVTVPDAPVPPNPPGPDLQVTNFRKNASAGYVGVSIGEVKKAGQWSIETIYQIVEAQAIPDADVFGIGRGNVQKERFTESARGKTNYKGLHTEVLYGITDHTYLDVTYDYSSALRRSIGGKHTYSKFEADYIVKF